MLRIRILLFLGLPDSDPLVDDVNVTSKSNKQKTLKFFLLMARRSLKKIAGSGPASGSGSISQRFGSADPDSYQNFMDPQHCCKPCCQYGIGGIALEFMASCDDGIVGEWHDDVELDAVQDPLLCDRVLTRPVPLLTNTNLKLIINILRLRIAKIEKAKTNMTSS